MKLLVIDDSMVSRMITKKVLLSINAEIIEASNGEDGIKKAREDRPDLIILDLLMPEMDGFKVLEKIKTESMGIPVIVLSADIQDTTRERVLKLGASGFVHKPPSEDDITKVIESILE